MHNPRRSLLRLQPGNLVVDHLARFPQILDRVALTPSSRAVLDRISHAEAQVFRDLDQFDIAEQVVRWSLDGIVGRVCCARLPG